MRWYRDNEDEALLKSLTTEQRWVLRLLGIYAEEKLLVKYGIKSSVHIDSEDIERDKRRAPTVIRYLKSQGLVTQPFYNGAMIPVSSAIETLMTAYKESPAFSVSGLVKVGPYTSGNKTPAFSIYSFYRDVTRLCSKDLIYIYCHQDEYDFKYYPEIRNHTAKVKLYPKALLDQLQDNIYKIHALYYGKNHLSVALERLYGWKVRAIHGDFGYVDPEDDRKNFMPVAEFDKDTPLTEEELTKRIAQAARQARFLRRTCRELFQLRAELRKLGTTTALEEKIQEGMSEHILEMSPIWINTDEYSLDHEKKLAKMFLKGPSVLKEAKEDE